MANKLLTPMAYKWLGAGAILIFLTTMFKREEDEHAALATARGQGVLRGVSFGRHEVGHRASGSDCGCGG
jgi:hypothetical protein